MSSCAACRESKAQRIGQAVIALALAPLRLPAWAYAARNSSTLGSALWVKIDGKGAGGMSGHGRTGRSPPQRLLIHHLALRSDGVNSSLYEVPGVSRRPLSVNLPLKSGMPWSRNGPWKRICLRLVISRR